MPDKVDTVCGIMLKTREQYNRPESKSSYFLLFK